MHRPFKARVLLDYGYADYPLVGCFWDIVTSNFDKWSLFFCFIKVHLKMVHIETLVKEVFVEDYMLLYSFQIFG